MKKLHERSKRIIALELDDDQLLSIVMALGLTDSRERASEANSFYKLENFEDKGDEVFDFLVDLFHLEDKFKPKPRPDIANSNLVVGKKEQKPYGY